MCLIDHSLNWMGYDFDLIPLAKTITLTYTIWVPFVNTTSKNTDGSEVMLVEEAQIFASYKPQKYLMANLYKMSECLERIAWRGIKSEV